MKRHRLSSWTSDTDELLMGLTRPLLAGLRPVVISPTAIVIFTYILLSRATSYPLLMLVVLRRDLISVLGSRL